MQVTPHVTCIISSYDSRYVQLLPRTVIIQSVNTDSKSPDIYMDTFLTRTYWNIFNNAEQYFYFYLTNNKLTHIKTPK